MGSQGTMLSSTDWTGQISLQRFHSMPRTWAIQAQIRLTSRRCIKRLSMPRVTVMMQTGSILASELILHSKWTCLSSMVRSHQTISNSSIIKRCFSEDHHRQLRESHYHSSHHFPMLETPSWRFSQLIQNRQFSRKTLSLSSDFLQVSSRER